MTNQEILTLLKTAATNEYAVKEILPQWDKSESFPSDFDTLKTCIKINTWSSDSFDFDMETIVKEYLPNYMLDVFFDMKEFMSNPRNELTTTCRAQSKLYGYPMDTQADKAFCQYDYSLRKYYEHSIINK